MATPDELSRFIRFQLSQLSTRNAHHEFEHLARHFARIRISERVIPATGPVSAGGDGGRDFETYRTYLSGTPIAGSTFLAMAGARVLVFACSLVKKIEPKIKSDLKTICESPNRVDDVYFFSEQDVPIGKRNKLIEYAREKYGVALTIIDGQALAEGLLSADTFWLAQQFLAVPAEMYPPSLETDEAYQVAHRYWISSGRVPSSFSDFSSVKLGLRRATFHKAYRADLLSWLGVIDQFRRGPVVELRRRATYEVCVAALRGLDDLSSRRDLVTEYFANIEELRSTSDLRDAAVLLSYCSSAVVQGHFDAAPATLHRFTIDLIRNLDARLKEDISVGRRCELLETRGYAEILWFRRGVAPFLNVDGMLGFWKKMLRLVPEAPLFPLEQFADLLTVLAPHFAGEEKFERLTDKVDSLLEKRTSGHVAAEKSRDRAMAYLKHDKVLQAIRQLHIAKVKWFSAETIRGSILSMLALSDCYLKLGFVYAAKHYSVGFQKEGTPGFSE